MNERTRRNLLTDTVAASVLLLDGCNRLDSTGAGGPKSDRTVKPAVPPMSRYALAQHWPTCPLRPHTCNVDG
jgi:hypothetical protein